MESKVTRKTKQLSTPESVRRERGQLQVKVRISDKQLATLRAQYGHPGDSSARVIMRAAGLV
jgi:hypothetical protein